MSSQSDLSSSHYQSPIMSGVDPAFLRVQSALKKVGTVEKRANVDVIRHDEKMSKGAEWINRKLVIYICLGNALDKALKAALSSIPGT